MSTKRPSPLVGYNTGVSYRGSTYHVQTEDSGIEHPHVITHLFAQGGHIVATRKTSYADHVGTDAYPEVVRRLIRGQHKQMLVDLRDGLYDSLLPASSTSAVATPTEHAVSPASMPAGPPPAAPGPDADERGRVQRTRRADTERTRDSLDEIIVGDLIQLLEE